MVGGDSARPGGRRDGDLQVCVIPNLVVQVLDAGLNLQCHPRFVGGLVPVEMFAVLALGMGDTWGKLVDSQSPGRQWPTLPALACICPFNV